MKLLMKWAQFINDYQTSTLGGPMTKHEVELAKIRIWVESDTVKS